MLNHEINNVLCQKRAQIERGNLDPEILGFIKGLEFSKALIELNCSYMKEENHEKVCSAQ